MSLEPVDGIARFRYAALGRASGLLEKDETGIDGAADGDGAKHEIVGLLVTSLEELKVAEEEIRSQNSRMLEQRASVESQMRHYLQIFLHSPAPSILTDSLGTIMEANFAAGRLMRRDPSLMARKPLAAMVDTKTRDAFRSTLRLISANGEPRAWRFLLTRGRDAAIEVCATVRSMEHAGPGGSAALFWIFSCPTSPETPYVWDRERLE
ncbi:MAG TPA: hypothetical protein VHV78_13395 [Gemmatimonadaceae bacterium]|nr:hypothetical protein [Gemmatimonadaceae bacterium]